MTKNKLQKTVQKLVEASFRDGQILEFQIVKSIKILKMLPSFEAIQALSQYLEGIKREERRHTLYIETAVDLTAMQIKKVKRVIGKKVKVIKTLINVNPDILGGFKIKIGDEVWDESIVSKIEEVRRIISGAKIN